MSYHKKIIHEHNLAYFIVGVIHNRFLDLLPCSISLQKKILIKSKKYAKTLSPKLIKIGKKAYSTAVLGSVLAKKAAILVIKHANNKLKLTKEIKTKNKIKNIIKKRELSKTNKKRGEPMAKKINKEGTQRYLSNVPSDKVFWVNNGPTLNNLEELAQFLKTAEENQFAYHVNSEKNDFANWVGDVIGDMVLKESISKAKTKTSMFKKVLARIKELNQ
jgi:transcriptional regulator with XRE-family HTH domain